MHYRITRLKHSEENQSKVIAYLESVTEQIESIEGLLSITLVSVSNTETLGLSKYESEEKMVNANPIQQKILSGAVEFFSGVPEVENGDVLWKWIR
tara:strand:+ start:101 stop:388 length:288 start_codon:yes stop_codon:yes gene_type:complete